MTKIENKLLIGLLDSQKMLGDKIDKHISEEFGQGYKITRKDMDYYVEKRKQEEEEKKKPFKISFDFKICHNTMIFCSVFSICLVILVIMLFIISSSKPLITFNHV